MEVIETDKDVRVSAELPGLEEKDVEVLMGDGVLTIRGEKKSEIEDKERAFSERSYGRFERRIPLAWDGGGGQDRCCLQERRAHRHDAEIAGEQAERETHRHQQRWGDDALIALIGGSERADRPPGPKPLLDGGRKPWTK